MSQHYKQTSHILEWTDGNKDRKTCQPPSDVDLRVMLTFAEFYTTMVGFVNLKLYNISKVSW